MSGNLCHCRSKVDKVKKSIFNFFYGWRDHSKAKIWVNCKFLDSRDDSNRVSVGDVLIAIHEAKLCLTFCICADARRKTQATRVGRRTT